ncbi:MAG: pyridoxal-phosphate dependent enzyme [Acidobacteria bacterium]|nr:pyridoxal-phosphate dependent enzyme [Acidobacteriota bacterium]NIM61724.1 pyridoxal-phosphate dependent enzyme [Acidobacteriota bacterium]NIO58904.1 pyridoxal-phosphate dependent enzyme [Acidobacteriota bacterium]NIQ29958.1 pyridoxal-phosphate dependent enzyme [Acidobacteriota bacterium]NIQ84691.1 pyridoxal-phosphate dependent enzyme [Acidobacteriota bacterium]
MPATEPLSPPRLEEIEAAAERIRPFARRTPLLQLDVDGPVEIWLKLENLQPIGSFKIRGAASAMARLSKADLADGVITASAGNFAQGLAYCAREMGLPCGVVVPDNAPRTKLEAIEDLGGRLQPVSYDRWWRALVEHAYPELAGRFIHPVADPDVVAGNATIGLEIADDLPDVESVVVPFGGGGLSSGIASALRARTPETKVYAAEVETAAPFAASLAAGEAVGIDHRPSFVDGIGGKSVMKEMWPMTSELLADSLVVSLDQIAEAIRLLVRRAKTVAEGAGAASVAAALAGRAGNGRVVCVISGGNIDADRLRTILAGQTPE